MDFLEKDLEDILFTTPSAIIKSRGLHHFTHSILYRQLNLDSYGRVDLLGVTLYTELKTVLITVFELKNKKISTDAFWQAVRYIKGVKEGLSSFNLSNHKIVVNAAIIGREIDLSGDFCFLPTIKSDVSLYTYSYEYDGIKFGLVSDTYSNSKFSGIDFKVGRYSSDMSLAKSLVKKSL